MLRFSPSRPLLTATLALLLLSPAPAALAMHMPIAIVVFGYALAGLAEAMYGALWNTALQQRVPIDVLARVSSYDSLVSLVALPLGTLAAGPAAAALGTSTTLAICALVVPLATLPVLLVNGIRSNAPQTSAPEPQIVAT
jgi:hypothetical protein